MRLFRHFILGLLILSSTVALAGNVKSTKDEQKQAVEPKCPSNQTYCCIGQDAEGFDICGCYSQEQCLEADNN